MYSSSPGDSFISSSLQHNLGNLCIYDPSWKLITKYKDSNSIAVVRSNTIYICFVT